MSCSRRLLLKFSGFKKLPFSMKHVTTHAICLIILLYCSATVNIRGVVRSITGRETSQKPGFDLQSDRQRLSSFLTQYEEFHSNGVQRLGKNDSNVKMIVYRCHSGCGGLGDRMSGIISVFYLAVAMERLFFIDSVHPVKLSVTLDRGSRVRWSFRENIPPQFSQVTIDARNTHERRVEIFEELFRAHSRDVEVIFVKINRYHVAMNLWGSGTSHHSFAGTLLRRYTTGCTNPRSCPHPSPANTMRAAFNFLFKFSPQVLSRAADMQESAGLLSREGKVFPYFAIHARIGGQLKHVTGSWQDPQRHSLDDASIFLDCAMRKKNRSDLEKNSSKSSPIQVPSKVVVFSDSSEFKERIFQLDPSVRHVGSAIVMHVDKSTMHNKTELTAGFVDTFAELYVISRAECIVGSLSTFSGLAASIHLPEGQDYRCYSYFTDCSGAEYDFWRAEGL